MELYENRYNLAVQHTAGVVTMQLAEYLEHVLFKVESKILANHKGTVPKATIPMAIKSTMIPLISLVINIIFHRIFFPFYCSLL